MNLPDTSRQKSVSRREFLKRSAVVAAVAGPALNVARGAHAAGSDVIRIGMVGCGGRCSGAAVEALSADPGARLVAMADLFADRVKTKREVLRKQKPGQVAVDDDHMFVGLDGYKKVIASVDVVLIACAAKFHPMYVKAAFEAGKHVFVEKPHAIDPLGIRTLEQACRVAKERKLGLLSGLQSRFHPAIRETMQRIHDGQIGQIVAIEENWLRGPYGATKAPAGWRELEVQYGNQYRFSWLCGDDVTQTLTHNLDRSLWALGDVPPIDCHGMGGRSGTPKLLGNVFDHHSVTYRCANDVRIYAVCRTTAGCYDEVSSIIMGSKGIAYPLAGRITGQNPWKFSGQMVSPYNQEHIELFKSIRAGAPLYCGDYMVRSSQTVVMGQLSCYSGRGITWDAMQKSDFCLLPKPEECTWDMEPPTKPDAEGVYPVCAVPGITKIV